MNYRNLLDWSYWFYQPFTAHGWVFLVWLLGFLALVLVGIVAYYLRAKQQSNITREFYRRLGSLGATMGLFGLMWLFFRQERITFLSWRFWLLLWLVVFVYWSIKLIYYIVKRLPQAKEERAKRELVEKYLPRKK